MLTVISRSSSRAARTPVLVIALAGVLCGLASQAQAQAQDATEAPLCTDRPTKANSTCTVPAGAWQLETDIGSYTRDSQPGTRIETSVFTNPTLKYGVSDRIDLQLNWAPQLQVKTTDRATGARSSLSGGGDIYLRMKARFYESDTATVAVLPFVKAPTARTGLGNEEWEGGIALPINFALPNSFSLTFGPEVDWLADSDGSGNHIAVINAINLARPLTPKLSMAVEVWSSINRDPAETIEQYSADIATAYLINPLLQLDVGANFGLNDRNPDAQVYVGLAHRF
ncbi:transporter [Xanthomonas campestris pv. campestris]|uniref:transporter n=1 Tax=Xanthomonas campestris TaxID=339 RepID=UPI000B1C1D79|nr:transporter [Xanthomonas campestris]MEA0699142.1 transporter [Xanthomonas campestris pv. campestris]MEA0778095.1 transporter [Xanthomonas campestris pv. campestris]MEA0786810.1 transporter [Xanthomonas campestris pv. campestris]MEA0861336.1 transporter [Xanthomonas campestris pv. campestris]MEA0942077.1 transporter [Xanthomonas campestris pv. campestris]